MSDSQEPSTSGDAPWLSEVMSPYGLSDEDATLRQGDSAKWRALFGGHKTKRFVAIPSEKSPPAPDMSKQRLPTSPPQRTRVDRAATPAIAPKSLSSVIMGQTFIAAILVIGAVYVGRTQSHAAAQFKGFLHSVYKQDYSNMVVPTVENWIHQLHWTSLQKNVPQVGTVPSSIMSANGHA